MSFHSSAFAAMASRSAVTAGSSRPVTFTAAAMYIADGNESLDDCDMLTWSLGCTGALLPSAVPASWQQRLDTTSLTFMLNCVPLPGRPHMQWEHLVVLPGQDLVADLYDQPMHRVDDPAARVVGVGSGLLQCCVGGDHLSRNQVLADAEMLKRT